MHILVTGGAGFIGSHLTEKLLAEGCRVTVLDNLHTGLAENVPAAAAFVQGDTRDTEILALFAREKFDAVVHLAGQTMVNVSVDDPYFDAAQNIQATVNILEACRKSTVGRVVFASTAAVYGDAAEPPIAEEAAPCPASFYGLSKWTVEKYLRLYRELYGLRYAALRFANVYGERQGDGGEGGVISIFAKRAAAGAPLRIFGDGGQTRDFIYAGDIAAGIYRALQAEAVDDVFNLGTNTEVSVNELTRLLGEIAGRDICPVYEAARPGDIYRSSLSNRRAAERLGWQPRLPLAEGLARTYRYFAAKAGSDARG